MLHASDFWILWKQIHSYIMRIILCNNYTQMMWQFCLYANLLPTVAQYSGLNLHEWHISDTIHFIPVSVPLMQDDIPVNGYLVMGSSIKLNGEAPRNSMLDGWISGQEVYSPYSQERLVCAGSFTVCSLIHPFCQSSFLQLSQPLNMPEIWQSRGSFRQWAGTIYHSI